jgi:NADH-quinone oxidoreductase subunit M
MPVLACFALVLTLSSIALPGLAGFAGEFPLLLGVFQRGWAEPAAHSIQLQTIAVLSLAGVVLGAWYMLWMFERVFFGTPRKRQPFSPRVHAGEAAPTVGDLSPREIVCLVLVVVPIVWIGLQPRFFLDRMAPTLDDLMKPAMRAVEKRGERKVFRELPGIAKPQAARVGGKPPTPRFQSPIPNR